MFPEIGRIRFAPTSETGTPTDFDDAEVTPIVVKERQILVEQSTFPEPAAKTAALGNDETAPVGETATFDLRIRNMLAADVTTLRAAGFAIEGYDVEIQSKDESTIEIYRDMILHVNHTGITKGNVYPYTKIASTKTTVGPDPSAETTVTP